MLGAGSIAQHERGGVKDGFFCSHSVKTLPIILFCVVSATSERSAGWERV